MRPNFNIPQCDDALLLVNPRALALHQFGVDERSSDMPVLGRNINDVDKTSLLRDAYALLDGTKDYQRLSRFWLRRGNQFEYLYRVVRCGHCELCTHSKQVDFVNRCRLESECYDCPPYFFTLTYAPPYLPADAELRYSDVQKFFKRLRRRFDKAGLPTDFRYVVRGEYGSRFGRPHYHVILFNNPYRCNELQINLHNRLKQDIFDSWSMCESQSFDFGQCAGGAAGYVSKYIGKRDCKFDALHVHKPFIHTSTANGGIGRPYLVRFKDYYVNVDTNEFTYTSNIDGKVHTITFGSNMQSFYHPSPARMVNPAVRDAYKDLSDRFARLVYLGAITWQYAYDFLEQVRPNKNIVTHRLASSDKSIRYKCWLFPIWLMNKERVQYDVDMYKLCDAPDVADVAIDDYYRFLSSFEPRVDNRGNYASRKLSIRNQSAVALDKEIF